MTNGNPRPEEDPAPPTTTGRSEASGGDDDGMAPPFVPGGSGSGRASEAVESDEAAFPFEPGWGTGPAHLGEAGGLDEEDDFPVEAFDIEEGQPSWLGESAPGNAEAVETRGMHAARELAGRLEEMARRLRDQGPEAARAELESPDRFNALLAGLVAGYLAGTR